MITSVTSESNAIIAQTGDLNKELDQQMAVMKRTMADYKAISNNISDMVEQISTVNDATIAINKEQAVIAEKIEGATAVAEQVAASTQEIAASADSAKEASGQVDQASKLLNEATQAVVEQIGRFKF